MRAHCLAALALALTACASAPSPAVSRTAALTSSAVNDPKASPEGATLVPTPEPSDLAAMEQRLFDLRPLRGSPAVRAPIAPEEMRPEMLPLLTIPEPLPVLLAPAAVTGRETDELLFDGKSEAPTLPTKHGDPALSVRLTLRDRSIGRMQIGYAAAKVSSGVVVPCGGPGANVRAVIPLRWETIQPTDGARVEFEVVNGWFDTAACRASVVERASVLAVPVLGRLLFAFRLRASTPDAPESLALLGPRFAQLLSSAVGGEADAQGSGFSRITLPLRRGAGASALGHLDTSSLLDWEKTMGPSGLPRGDLQVGVELAQGVEDLTPVAIAYTRLR
jgi:hypothetical protein